MNFFNFLKVKRSIIRGDREMGSYVLMWNILRENVFMMKTSLHDENVEEFLRIKTSQWISRGVLEEQIS